MTKLRALIFDLDDTLYPERSYVLSGFSAVADWIHDHLGDPASKVLGELVELHDGGSRGDTFDLWLIEQGLDVEAYVPVLIDVYRRHRPAIKPFDVVPGLLVRLHDRYRLGIVSDGFGPVQRLKLEALGLEDHFDATIFSDEIGREAWKPSAEPFRQILTKLEVIPMEAAYIGDNPLKDFAGPRALGMQTILVRTPRGYHAGDLPPTPRHVPHFSINGLAELEDILL